MSRLLLTKGLAWTRPAQQFRRRWMQTKNPADIFFYDEQDAITNLNTTRLQDTISRIRSELSYENYSVTLILVDDEEMQRVNKETRDVDGPTDILSFPFHPHTSPGIIVKPQVEGIPDLYTLGDMMVDVPYVMRSCVQDQQEPQDEQERGVSGAMANIYNPETRIHMLMVHGMLHLVGYDHIEDDDYELMVAKEEELLDILDLPTAPR